MFEFFKYPYTIRNDAIIAVGAPSTIGFLVKALYWFYVFTIVHFYQEKQVLDPNSEILPEKMLRDDVI